MPQNEYKLRCHQKSWVRSCWTILFKRIMLTLDRENRPWDEVGGHVDDVLAGARLQPVIDSGAHLGDAVAVRRIGRV